MSDTPQIKKRALREKTTGVASPHDGCCSLFSASRRTIPREQDRGYPATRRRHIRSAGGELNQRSTARAVIFPGQREMSLTKQSDFVVNPFVISFGAFQRLRRRHIHPFPRINCMKASIFFVIRVRSGPRFCSRQIPQKNVIIRSARDSLPSVPPRAAARLSIRS